MNQTCRFPAEWEPQSAVLIAWPHAGTDWADRLGRGRGDLHRAGGGDHPLPAGDRLRGRRRRAGLRATRACASARIDMDRVHFVDVPYDDTWLRDSGPITLRRRRRLPPARFPLHRLGRQVRGQPGRPAGRAPACRRPVRRRRAQHDRFRAGRRRHRDRRRRHAADHLAVPARAPSRCQPRGTRPRSWPAGCSRTACCGSTTATWKATTPTPTSTPSPASPRSTRSCIQACDDPADSHYAELQAMGRELAALRTGDGAAVPAVPAALGAARPRWRPAPGRQLRQLPDHQRRRADARPMAIAGRRDQAAPPCWRRRSPGARSCQVPCRPLIWQNGSLHCVTMQLPAGALGDVD